MTASPGEVAGYLKGAQGEFVVEHLAAGRDPPYRRHEIIGRGVLRQEPGHVRGERPAQAPSRQRGPG
jgi:hypothetical protein